MKREVDLVVVDVQVADARGNFVGSLGPESFRVLDDGESQPIIHFSPTETPARLLVLVETSPAVYLIHKQHLEAAYALLEGLGQEDQVALASYDQSARLLLPFTADKKALSAALLALRYNLGMGGLHLFESLATALDWIESGTGRTAILLLGTGLDTGEADQQALLERKLRATSAVVFAVALGGDWRTHRQPSKSPRDATQSPLSFEQADRNLRSLAEQTGGRASFPASEEEFPEIYRQIARAMRHQYSLGFRPSRRDGRLHRIEVQVADGSGRILGTSGKPGVYRVFARREYFALLP